MTPAEEADLSEILDAAVLDRLLAGVDYLRIDSWTHDLRRVRVVVGNEVAEEHQRADESVGATVLRALAVARGER